MSSERARGIEVVQGVVVLMAITLGIIPLVQVLVFHGNPGLLAAVLPDAPSASHWMAPLAVVIVAAGCVLALEATKNRR